MDILFGNAGIRTIDGRPAITLCCQVVVLLADAVDVSIMAAAERANRKGAFIAFR